jgi:hypothetical protein
MNDGVLCRKDSCGLFSSFCKIEIKPEGFSIAGFFRTINLFLDTFIRSEALRAVVANTVFPTTNLAGLLLDVFSHGRTQFTTNYSCVARKRDASCTETVLAIETLSRIEDDPPSP